MFDEKYIRFDWAMKRLLSMGLSAEQAAQSAGLSAEEVKKSIKE